MDGSHRADSARSVLELKILRASSLADCEIFLYREVSGPDCDLDYEWAISSGYDT